MTNKPIEHGEFIIQMQGDGFRLIPTAAGKVASFWVVNKKKDLKSVFACARSLTDAFENIEDREDRILESFVNLIKQYIDDSKIKNLDELTFEYKSHQFILVENPSWWTKKLSV